MRVISDTSTICYLFLIGKVDLLPALYQRVLIPRAVALELSHPSADHRLRTWIADPPTWLEIVDAPRPATRLSRLGPGESEAISLAEAMRADLVILDERKARQAAIERGLPIIGLLGILGDAADKDLVDLPEALDLLRQTNFRAEPRLLRSLLDRRSESGS